MARAALGTPSREAIAAAALRMVDADGVSELSMRKLAAELGAHPTALYRRVANRDEILDMVANAVLAEVTLDLVGPWQQRLTSLAVRFRGAVQRHPQAASLLNTWTTAQESTEAVSEAVFAALSEAGLAGRDLLEAYNAYLGYVHGAAVTEVLARPSGASASSAGRRVDDKTWQAHPGLAEAVAQFEGLVSTAPESELRAAIFLAGVETVVAGIAVRYGVS